MNPKVSVIIPVYQAQDFLGLCLDSVLAQSFTDYELILVDDGSVDASGIICDEYERKDGRIKVIHQQNVGSSAARNTGLEEAKGDYILFIDADDWVDSNHLESLVTTAEKENADVVLCGLYHEFPKKTVLCLNIPHSFKGRSVIVEMMENKIHGGIVLKLVKHSLYEGHQLQFPFSNFYEDMYISAEVCLYAANIASTGIATYHYRYNALSQTNDQHPSKRLNCFYEFVNNLDELAKKHSLWSDKEIKDALYDRINRDKLLLLELPYHSRHDILKAYGCFPDSWKWYKTGCSIIRLLNYLALRYGFLLGAQIYKHLRVVIKRILKGTI